MEAARITLEEAHSEVKSGKALLVCAYNDDLAFKKYHLEGAISYGDFAARILTLSKDQEIIFYCA